MHNINALIRKKTLMKALADVITRLLQHYVECGGVQWPLPFTCIAP